MRANEFVVEYKKYPTQDYEGIKISMVEKDGRLFVRAIDDWGVNELGSVEFVIGDSKELDPQDLQVDHRYQGQGIARTMYDYVKSRGYKIVRSWDQTDAGAGFWNKHRGEDVRVWEQGVAEGSEQINEFSRTDDEGREFMSWREFLAIVTPAMRAWGFRPEYKNPEIMYSRPGRSQDEFYVIILQPQNDMVQYSFMTVDHDQPDMHETNFVGMSRLGAQSLLDKIDDDYSLSDLKQDMAEARSNPNFNLKTNSGKYDLTNYVEDNITDWDDWAVSMTQIPKLGINPKAAVSEDTPKGIYFYPLQYFMRMYKLKESLPWGDNMPYMQLFQYDRTGEMTRQTKVDPARLKQALKQYCSDDIIQQAIDEPEYDGTPYWFIYDCLSKLGKDDEFIVIRWNKILRELGFTSVYDPGEGWIAYNEPTQGVVLDPRIIKQHRMFINRNPTRQYGRLNIEDLVFDLQHFDIQHNDYSDHESRLLRIRYDDLIKEKKIILDVAKSMLKQFLGKSREEAKAMGYEQALKAASDKVLEILRQHVAESSDHMLAEEQPEVRPHRVTDKELVQLLGKGKTNAMLRHPWFQRYSSYEKAYRYARDRWGFVTVDMFPYMTSVNKTADGSIRPTIYVSFIFSYTGPKVVQAHQFRRDQEPDEFEKRNPVTGGWKHGSTWKVDKTDEVEEGVPQPGESSGAPKQFGPDAKIETRQMTVKQIISSIPGVPYYNNVVDDWDAKDYSWNVTKKTIEYATYLKDHPESLAQLPPIIVLNGKFEDGAHRVSAIWLLQQRMDTKNPLWANTKLKVQFVKQGVTENDDQSTQIRINSNARALAWIEKVYAAYPQTWQNNHVMPLGGSGEDQQFAMFELVPSMSQRGAVEIKWFQAYPLRQGVGTRAMQELQRLAQADGISLTLFPWDKGQVSQGKLMKFYKSAGFQPTVKGSKSLAWSPESVTEDAIQEDAVMGKIEQGGKIVRILKKQHTVPFSDETDWLLIDTDPARGNRGLGLKWIPASTRFEWVRPYRDTIDENFADGKGPGRPGDSQRHGIPKGATMAQLEKAAKAPGRKGQLARWQLNMRRGRKK